MRPGAPSLTVAALLSTLVISAAGPARGQTTAASAAPRATEMPLSPLPDLPRWEIPPPTKDQLETLDALLDAIASREPDERERARRTILEVSRELVPAIARRIDTIAEHCDRRAMQRLLLDVRDEARDAERARMKALGEKGKVRTPDYLEMLTDRARADDANWDPLVRVVAMSRMLAQIGTTESLRELVRVRVRYDFLRIDVQLLLEAVGDKSIPALIETLKHPARAVAHWAASRLDIRGKAIPSEAIQTEDLRVLADVLLAYGRIRDPDAARVIISFANSERAQVRLAARQAVRMLGEVANWQLRDTYENIVGKRPPREWSWERTARELFTEFDRLRLARVQQLYDQGKKALRKGDLDAAAKAFDGVLVRSPRFEHAGDMIPAYVGFARQHLDDRPDDARRALSRARRLIGDDPERKAIDSLLMTLDAEKLLERDVADQVLLRRALELDPTNARAQRLLDGVQRGDVETQTAFNRHVAAGTVGAVALVAILLILLRRPRRLLDTTDPPSPPNAHPAPAPEPGEAAGTDEAPPKGGATQESGATDSGAGEGAAPAPIPTAEDAARTDPIPAPEETLATDPDAATSEGAAAGEEAAIDDGAATHSGATSGQGIVYGHGATTDQRGPPGERETGSEASPDEASGEKDDRSRGSAADD